MQKHATEKVILLLSATASTARAWRSALVKMQPQPLFLSQTHPALHSTHSSSRGSDTPAHLYRQIMGKEEKNPSKGTNPERSDESLSTRLAQQCWGQLHLIEPS